MLIMIPGFISGSFLIYSMSYIQLFPDYICTSPATHDEYHCMPVDFCSTDIPHRINWANETSIHNWVEQLDLACKPKTQIGLIGSMQFAGWGISAAFLPRTADLYGRRRVYILSMTGLSIFLLCIMLSPNLIFTLVMMFLFGTMSVGRAAIGFLFMQEFIPVSNQAMTGTIVLCFDTFTGVLSTVYFYYISSDCRWIQLFGILCGVVSILGAFFILPESPKYLHCQKRWTELRKVLSYMGKLNGKREPFTGTFDREGQTRRFNYINDASRGAVSTIGNVDPDLLKTPKLVV